MEGTQAELAVGRGKLILQRLEELLIRLDAVAHKAAVGVGRKGHHGL